MMNALSNCLAGKSYWHKSLPYGFVSTTKVYKSELLLLLAQLAAILQAIRPLTRSVLPACRSSTGRPHLPLPHYVLAFDIACPVKCLSSLTCKHDDLLSRLAGTYTVYSEKYNR